MKIAISSRKDVRKHLPGDFRYVISINDLSGDTLPPFAVRNFRGGKILCLFFDDVGSADSAARYGYIPPTDTDVKNIAQFVTTDDPVLVHCFAGISRSSAAAMIVAAVRGLDPLDYLDPQIHRPNLLMLEYADHLLGTSLKRIAEEYNDRRKASSMY